MSAPPIDHTLQHCRSLRDALEAVADDAADAITRARLMEHVAACDRCRAALTAARAYRATMRRVGEGTPAPSSLREAVARTQREGRGSSTR
jgi:predicted anti-sigma-YlaC factor YlaD